MPQDPKKTQNPPKEGYLEFEKLITELEERLSAIKAKSQNKKETTQTIQELEERIEQLTKETFSQLTSWQRVQLSRHVNRPYSLDYIAEITSDFEELHGDRAYKDDKAIVGGLGSIEGRTFMIIGQQKGRNTKERQYRRFGMANPEGYRKALRLMNLAEKFDKPILTLIDTPGAYPGIEAEQRGQAQAIAYNMQTMLALKVPIICIVIGEGASGGAIAIGVGDRVWMMENTWYSVISPESCSSILWRSWDYKEQAAESLKLTPTYMHKNGLIDGIIEEPVGGAHKNKAEAAKNLKNRVMNEIKVLDSLSPETRIAQRMEKFSRMCVYGEENPS